MKISSTMRPLARLTRSAAYAHTRIEQFHDVGSSQMVSTAQGVVSGMVHIFVSFRLSMVTLGPAHRSDRCCPQEDTAVRGGELLLTLLPAV
jgi:hypothetical protein